MEAGEWEQEREQLSFEDSDRFEEDSLCSCYSEAESLCNNWRGWKKQQNGSSGAAGSNGASHVTQSSTTSPSGAVESLTELAALAVATHIPFEFVERYHLPIPETLQLRIAFLSFAEDEDDIRLYSCLANGSADEFQKGEYYFRNKAVKDPLQIGFHLSATVVPPNANMSSSKGQFNVAVVFDRRRITQCNCTCTSSMWCAHVVALCLFRIHCGSQVCLRAPVSESLSRLRRDQLQKFAQYLISELPQQILPTAQKILDDLLSDQQTAIQDENGAPDPTAGASVSDDANWYLAVKNLHTNIKKTLGKFIQPSPVVFSDVNYLSSSEPPASTEYTALLRPLRGKEPEGMWNLLSIVREMYKRHDSNAVQLLEIITEEILSCDTLLLWWFATKVFGCHVLTTRYSMNVNPSTQHAASSLCDQVVSLWRLAALDPVLSRVTRHDLSARLRLFHRRTIDAVRKARGSSSVNAAGVNLSSSANHTIKKQDIELFVGFKPAIESCQIDWDSFQIDGVNYRFRATSRQRLPALQMDTSNTTIVSHNMMPFFGPSSILATASAVVTAPTLVKLPSMRNASSSSEGFCDLYTASPSGIVTQISRDSECSSLEPSRQNSVERVLSAAAASVGSPEATAGQESAIVKAPVNREDSQTDEHSSDEYQMYFFDNKTSTSLGSSSNRTSTKAEGSANGSTATDENINYFAGIRPFTDPHEVLFARAEALYAHGYLSEACTLAQRLADTILMQPPGTIPESCAPTINGKNHASGIKRKKQAALLETNAFNTTPLSKLLFIVEVLLKDPSQYNFAFRVGLYGLEMARNPCSSKALEVKLAYQEAELVQLLKRIPLGDAELDMLRQRADRLRNGQLKSRGDAILPLMLAQFIFDSLCLNNGRTRPKHPSKSQSQILALDEVLGFEAAVAVLGMKTNVSEADHALLCESIRRQKGELALAMLVQYKDDQEKLSRVLDALLDRTIHPKFKALSLSYYLSNRKSHPSSSSGHAPDTSQVAAASCELPQSIPNTTLSSGLLQNCGSNISSPSSTPRSMADSGAVSLCGDDVASSSTVTSNPSSLNAYDLRAAVANAAVTSGDASAWPLDTFPTSTDGTAAGSPRKASRPRVLFADSKDTDSSAVEEDDYKSWEARFRCTNLKSNKGRSVGMAAVDSSAPETTSSDNSPTLVRRSWGSSKTGPGSDSGSNGSCDSASSGTDVHKNRNESPPTALARLHLGNTASSVDSQGQQQTSRSSTPNMKSGGGTSGSSSRYKHKSRMPSLPNQPSESLAYFMFSLAKGILTKAGGSSSTLFQSSTNQTGIHRLLHICAFHVGLYALGLHNCVTSNWLSRTYSSLVSWITGVATEIGSPAISVLIDTWEGHLTPPEVAIIADRASKGRDAHLTEMAAKLALSCLPYSHALNQQEITRALMQCREQSREMLERACLAVESAAKDGGVFPEVLFEVARSWYSMYERLMIVSGTAGVKSSSTGTSDRACSTPNEQVQLNVTGHAMAASLQMPVVAAASGPAHCTVASDTSVATAALASVASNEVRMVPITQPGLQQHHGQILASNGPALHQVPITYALGMPQQISGGPIQLQPNHHHASSPVGAPPVNAHPSAAALAAAAAFYPVMPTAAQANPQNHLHGYGIHHTAAQAQQPAAPTGALAANPTLLAGPSSHSASIVVTAAPPNQQQQPALVAPTAVGPHNNSVATAASLAAARMAAAAANNQHHHAAAYLNAAVAQAQAHQYQQAQITLANAANVHMQSHNSSNYHPVITAAAAAAHLHHHQQQQQQQRPASYPPSIPAGSVPANVVVTAYQPVAPGQLAAVSNGTPPMPVSIQQQQSIVAAGGGAPGLVDPHSTANLSLHSAQPGITPVQLHYLLSAYRVGMLAMEPLSRRVHEDRPQTKYSKSPPYADDIKWLLSISKKLGSSYLQQFSSNAVNAVVSPFVLYELALEAATYLARNNPAQIHTLLRTPVCSALVQKCIQMFNLCAHQRIHHITQTEYDDFVSIILHARNAFNLAPGGLTQFNELLQSLKKTKSCKKELWQKIVSGLATHPPH